MNAKVIGEHIKEYRKNNNVSQRELAEMLFVSEKNTPFPKAKKFALLPAAATELFMKL